MVHIAAFYPRVREVGRKVLRHFLGQRRHQCALALFYSGLDLVHEVVYLPLYRADGYLRVEQARRPDYLLRYLPGALPLVLARRSGDVHRLAYLLLKLLELQRPVVEGRGQAEAVVHQRLLPCPVAPVHRPHLRQRHMRLVHEQHEVLREVVQQRHRRAARGPAGDYPAVVLNARAVAQLLYHLDIEAGALLYPLRLEVLVLALKIRHTLVALAPYLLHRRGHLLLRCDVVARGIYGHMVQYPRRRARHRVYLRDAVYLVPEEFYPYSFVIRVHRKDLHRVAAHAEHVAVEGDIVALVSYLNELFQQLISVFLLARPERYHHVGVVDRVAEAVYA